MSDDVVIYLDAAEFAEAVVTAMISAISASDANGSKVAMRVTPFRMALEIRKAIGNACGMPVEVRGWQELIATMKPPFPPDIAAPAVSEKPDG